MQLSGPVLPLSSQSVQAAKDKAAKDRTVLQMQDAQRVAIAESQALQSKLHQQMEDRGRETAELQALLQASLSIATSKSIYSL